MLLSSTSAFSIRAHQWTKQFVWIFESVASTSRIIHEVQETPKSFPSPPKVMEFYLNFLDLHESCNPKSQGMLSNSKINHWLPVGFGDVPVIWSCSILVWNNMLWSLKKKVPCYSYQEFMTLTGNQQLTRNLCITWWTTVCYGLKKNMKSRGIRLSMNSAPRKTPFCSNGWKEVFQ